MNDFDRFLEFELRQMLDPVVTTPTPPRRRRRTNGLPLLMIVPPQVDASLAVEPVVVPGQPALLLP